MAAETGTRTAPPPRLERVIEALMARDPSGGSWLPALLQAAPDHARLGELAAAPGWLDIALAARGASGRLACFDHPAVPSRALLRWFIDHPEALRWPEGVEQSEATRRLRRALIDDDPPGARARAQDRARELLAASPGLRPDWWRFEEIGRLDCVLMTGRLVVTIAARGPGSLAPATPWYPARTRLVRDLESARQLAGSRRWATLLLSDAPVPGGSGDAVAGSLPAAAPHLDDAGRQELADAYLGNVTWQEAAAALQI